MRERLQVEDRPEWTREEAHYQTARVHHADQWRGGGLAACGARAAADTENAACRRHSSSPTQAALARAASPQRRNSNASSLGGRNSSRSPEICQARLG